VFIENDAEMINNRQINPVCRAAQFDSAIEQEARCEKVRENFEDIWKRVVT